MRKTIFAFATTALALWWVFGPIVASVRYSKSNEAKLDAAAKRFARGTKKTGILSRCTWHNLPWGRSPKNNTTKI